MIPEYPKSWTVKQRYHPLLSQDKAMKPAIVSSEVICAYIDSAIMEGKQRWQTPVAIFIVLPRHFALLRTLSAHVCTRGFLHETLHSKTYF